MKKLLFATLFILLPSGAWAQNVTCATRPTSDYSNACANTKFVRDAEPVLFASQFGAICDGGTDDLAAFNSLLSAAVAQKKPARFSGSCYISGSLNFTSSVDFGGVVGYNNLTSRLLFPPTVSALVINTTGAVNLHDFGVVYTSAANNGTTGIEIKATTYNEASRINRLWVQNAYYGLVASRGTLWNMKETVFWQFGSIGAIVANSDIADAGDMSIESSSFFAADGAVGGLSYQSGGGLRFVNNKINGNGTVGNGLQYGLELNLASDAVTSDFIIVGNSIEGLDPADSAGISFRRAGTTGSFNNVNITGNEIATPKYCINVPTDGVGTWLSIVAITNNTCVLSPSVASTGINLSAVNSVVVEGNTIQSNEPSSVGVAVAADTSNVVLGANSFTGTFANEWTNASGSFKVANAITPVDNGVVVSSAKALSALATANNGVLATNGSGVPAITSTLPGTVQSNITATGTITSGVWNGTNIDLAHGGTNASLTASNGGIVYSGTTALGILSGTATASLPLLSGSSTTPTWATVSYPTSATSGGIPYFSSTSAMATSALLASGKIMVGGGAGAAPSTTGCGVNANSSLACSSSTAFTPQISAENTTADANAGQIVVKKSRSSGDTQANDALGYFAFQGYANSGYRSVALIQASQTGASSGSNIPSKLQLITSNSVGAQNHVVTLNEAGHLAVTAQANAPSVSAGCNGAGSSISGGGGVANDTHGTVVGQTSAATTCTVSFGTAFANAPDCVFSGFQSPITVVNSVATTGFQVTFASTANYKFSYVCKGI